VSNESKDKRNLPQGSESASTTGEIMPDPGLPDSLRSLTRVLVGGLLLGVKGMRIKLREWELQASEAQAESPAIDTPAGEVLPAPTTPESNLDKARYAAIGLVFDTENRVQRQITALGDRQSSLSKRIQPINQRLGSSRLLSPARERFERLVSRGEQQINRWAAVGRIEEQRSQELAKIAFDKTNDMYLAYLGENPEVRDLLQAQSTGLASEMVEEVRERTVSTDTLLEGKLRALLRRAPRASLDAPPPEIRYRATTVRPPEANPDDPADDE